MTNEDYWSLKADLEHLDRLKARAVTKYRGKNRDVIIAFLEAERDRQIEAATKQNEYHP